MSFKSILVIFLVKEMPGSRCAQDWSNPGIITILFA